MNNTYIIEKENIVEVLDDIEAFKKTMSKFMNDYDHYSYDIKIIENPNNQKWIVELNVRKDEPKDNNNT